MTKVSPEDLYLRLGQLIAEMPDLTLIQPLTTDIAEQTSPAKTAGRWWRRLGRGPRRSRPLLLHRLEQAQKILDPHANLSLVNRTTEPFPSLKLEPLAPHRHFTILSMSRDLLASIDQPG
jgi:hypothetical protein